MVTADTVVVAGSDTSGGVVGSVFERLQGLGQSLKNTSP